jgi:hypothetical protein
MAGWQTDPAPSGGLKDLGGELFVYWRSRVESVIQSGVPTTIGATTD